MNSNFKQQASSANLQQNQNFPKMGTLTPQIKSYIPSNRVH